MQEKYSRTQKQRPKLSVDRITEAAIEIADQAGLAAVTMRAVAKRLGVEAMSLYNHVRSKAALLAHMTDAVAAKIRVPQVAGAWRQQMQARARSAHQVLMAHPWAAELIVSNAEPGPAMLAYVEATLACLAEAGFDPQQADHAWNAMDSYIYGFTLQALRFPFAPEDYAAVAAENLAMIPVAVFPNLRNLAQLVAARQYDGLHQLDFGFDLLLQGLEAQLAAVQA